MTKHRPAWSIGAWYFGFIGHEAWSLVHLPMATAAAKPKQPAGPTHYPLVLIICAMAGGVVVDRLFPLAAMLWTVAAVGTFCAWLPVWLLRRDRVASALLLGSVLAAGGAWHHLYWRLY